MKSRTLQFLAGGALLLAALVLLAFWKRRELAADSGIGSGPADARARLYGAAEQQRRRAVDRRDRLRRQVADLRTAEADLRGKLPKAEASPAPGAAGKEPGAEPRNALFENFSKVALAEWMSRLKSRLELTAAQEERLRDLFLNEIDEVIETVLVQGASGEKAMELKVRAAVSGILDSRQMAEYDRIQSEENERQAALRRETMVSELTSALDLKDEQAVSLEQILKGDPTLVKDDSYVESISPDEMDSSIQRLEVTHRRLAAVFQPQLSGEQVSRLETHFKDSEEHQRELIRYYRLFVAEDASSRK
ncbi:MAG TPA: hypothetical protein VG457_15865 [Planctomycetota bacterium]|jgi:hypothetical protein|nr:hypothetical protein [Planctomycetota bacterium]